jgi:hypothetical protein
VLWSFIISIIIIIIIISISLCLTERRAEKHSETSSHSVIKTLTIHGKHLNIMDDLDFSFILDDEFDAV